MLVTPPAAGDPPEQAGLHAKDVVKYYGGVHALDGVSIDIVRGTVVGLIGPNGSGKTTLLNCISGVTRATRGSVRLGDREIAHQRADEIARSGIARTFQSIRLFTRMTGLENVEVSSVAGAGTSRREARLAALALLEEFGIDHLGDVYVEHLSYGDRRRVEIARALASQPRFLLLDEPAAGMNDVESAALGELIQAVRVERGCGVLLVDHDLRLIMQHCDHIYVLNEGTKIAEGSPTAIQSNAQVIAAYIGESNGAPEITST